MDQIKEAISGLPKNVACFLLEIRTGKANSTMEIGKLLKEARPLSVLMSFDPYVGTQHQFTENSDMMLANRLESNVMLFNISDESFLQSNVTKFHIIFAHSGVDAIPFKRFLVEDGKVVVI